MSPDEVLGSQSGEVWLGLAIDIRSNEIIGVPYPAIIHQASALNEDSAKSPMDREVRIHADEQFGNLSSSKKRALLQTKMKIWLLVAMVLILIRPWTFFQSPRGRPQPAGEALRTKSFEDSHADRNQPLSSPSRPAYDEDSAPDSSPVASPMQKVSDLKTRRPLRSSPRSDASRFKTKPSVPDAPHHRLDEEGRSSAKETDIDELHELSRNL